jgi:hypothetical protein
MHNQIPSDGRLVVETTALHNISLSKPFSGMGMESKTV